VQGSEQYDTDSYGAASLSVVSVVSFCNVDAADSPSMPASSSGATAESDLAASVFGMSQVASVDGGWDSFCCGRSGSLSMFDNSNS